MKNHPKKYRTGLISQKRLKNHHFVRQNCKIWTISDLELNFSNPDVFSSAKTS